MKCMLALILVLLSAGSGAAQVLQSGETEAGSDGRGGSFASHYALFDTAAVNGYVRPFWVNNTLLRVEFGAGPTFKTRGVTTKLTFGGTTDRELMFAGTWLAKVADRQVIGIADAKMALGKTDSSLYNKVIWGLDRKSVINLRYEQLYIRGAGIVFVRPGVEYQIQFSVGKVPAHIYVAPFYDPKIKQVGGQIGFRFFDWNFSR